MPGACWHRLGYSECVLGIAKDEMLVAQHIASYPDFAPVGTDSSSLLQCPFESQGCFLRTRKTVKHAGKEAVDFPEAARVVWVDDCKQLASCNLGLAEAARRDVCRGDFPKMRPDLTVHVSLVRLTYQVSAAPASAANRCWAAPPPQRSAGDGRTTSDQGNENCPRPTVQADRIDSHRGPQWIDPTQSTTRPIQQSVRNSAEATSRSCRDRATASPIQQLPRSQKLPATPPPAMAHRTLWLPSSRRPRRRFHRGRARIRESRHAPQMTMISQRLPSIEHCHSLPRAINFWVSVLVRRAWCRDQRKVGARSAR